MKNTLDDFNAERVCWVATLSNGEKIYQDDNRPDKTPSSAWLRLRNYVQQEKVCIVGLGIKFFTHEEQAAIENAEGYYFSQKIQSVMGGDSTSVRKSYIVGYLLNNKIHCTEWLVPEIIPISHEVRDVVENDPRLIINGG